MSNYLYRLQNVSKEYNGRRVLEVDNLKIARGEILGVVGPSGLG